MLNLLMAIGLAAIGAYVVFFVLCLAIGAIINLILWIIKDVTKD
jgi:hypothetical protein